jgi:hypothetical protein
MPQTDKPGAQTSTAQLYVEKEAQPLVAIKRDEECEKEVIEILFCVGSQH